MKPDDTGPDELEQRLSRVTGAPGAEGGAGHMDALRADLAERADREGLLQLSYSTTPSPLGDLLLVASAQGVVRVAFEREDHDRVLDELARSIGPRVLRSPARTREVQRQLDEYFLGRRRSFDVSVDLRLVSGFRRRVVEHLRSIDYGTTASYSTVAAGVGNPAAVRAVGSACAHNPVPVLLPCHRVVRSDGSIGQYLGGSDAKVALLALESSS
jgi:methylated-DNA-[protein]-cysteine S-methyltransferase